MPIERTPDGLRGANGLPRRFHAIMFCKPHPMAGGLVRVGREAAIYFNRDEAEIRQATLEDEGKITAGMTRIRTVVMKELREMLKPEHRKGRT